MQRTFCIESETEARFQANPDARQVNSTRELTGVGGITQPGCWKRCNVSLRKINVSPFKAGIALGFGAALVQAYFKVVPPAAYGVCMVCHPKDLVNWIADHVLNTDWGYSVASTNWPILTVIGVVLGALVAAYQHGELRLRAARQPLFYFINGFLMMNFGLILGSCPIRIVLLSAYGNLIGLVGWICVVVGVLLGVWALRWNARRSVEREATT